MHKSTLMFLSVLLLSASAAFAQEGQSGCSVENRSCVLEMLEKTAGEIDKQAWQDQTWRELAKTYAADGQLDKAVSFISKIKTPDTQAMTIRGIGMAAADNNLKQEEYSALFTKLREQAETIKHPPSYAIALTYIAMAQAFAGDDEGAWATAADMENDALRHKAYGETAEIQAEKGHTAAAMKSISMIDSTAYRNKSYTIVTKILADKKLLAPALAAAEKIDNPYKKAEALQYVLDVQKPREK